MDRLVIGRFPLRDVFPTIDSVWKDSLSRRITWQEVHDALFEMSTLKVPGIDELHAQFYQISMEYC